jgi:phosphate transport system ATP-binding protein
MGKPEPEFASAVAVVKDLSVSFGGRRVLKEVHLTLEKGGLYVLIGRSGAGKTTLLRSFNRLNECLPGCRVEGSLRLNIRDRWVEVYRGTLPVTELRRQVGMVFQTPNILPTSVEKNVSLPLKLVLGMGKNEIPGRVERALREVHLWDEVRDRLHSPAATLSGGQQQRLCLARALALEPVVLLLDEPTASLDFMASQKIEELLLTLKDRYTLLAVSHSLSQARRLADRVLVLNEGRLAGSFEGKELQQSETFQTLLEEVF